MSDSIIKLPGNAYVKYRPHKGGWEGELYINDKRVTSTIEETILQLIGRLVENWNKIEARPKETHWKLPFNARMEIIPNNSGYVGVLYIDDKEACRTEQCCIADVTMALIRNWNDERVLVMRPYTFPPGKIEVQLQCETWTAVFKDPQQRKDNIIGQGLSEAEAVGNLVLRYNVMLNSVKAVPLEKVIEQGGDFGRSGPFGGMG